MNSMRRQIHFAIVYFLFYFFVPDDYYLDYVFMVCLYFFFIYGRGVEKVKLATDCISWWIQFLISIDWMEKRITVVQICYYFRMT